MCIRHNAVESHYIIPLNLHSWNWLKWKEMSDVWVHTRGHHGGAALLPVLVWTSAGACQVQSIKSSGIDCHFIIHNAQVLHRDCSWHCLSGLAVPQSDSLWEQTVLISCCFSVQRSVAPPRGKKFKQFGTRVWQGRVCCLFPASVPSWTPRQSLQWLMSLYHHCKCVCVCDSTHLLRPCTYFYTAEVTISSVWLQEELCKPNPHPNRSL